jgi:hypothetical protein
MKINSDSLNKFLDRIKIEKMICELPVKINGNVFSICTMDKLKQVVIQGAIHLSDQVPNPMSFSFPDLTKLGSILDEFSGEIDVDLNGTQATFMDSLKSIKTEIVKTDLFDAIQHKIKLSATSSGFNVLMNGENKEYDDFIQFNGKLMKYYLEKCKSVKSPFYLIEQTNEDLILSSEYKLDSVKMKIDVGSRFTNNKSFWMVSFIKDIFKKNPYECKMYVNERTDPLILDFLDNSGDYNTLTFFIAPRG